ncbi:MAG: 7TM diverse intracellular signaling domain-containing protein [Spirochaetales bacterium]|nr:7TM diverse intracellular signaling domain-containing protein [Spirochaetales bacterium]
MKKVLLPLFLLFLINLHGHEIPDAIPLAREGVIDLRGSLLDNPVKLNGEWLFYWNEFLVSAPQNRTEEWDIDYMEVPAFWNNPASLKQEYPREGYATYQIKILLPPHTDFLALELKYVFTSYRLYINGELYDAVGVPGVSTETGKPAFRSKTVSFPTRGSELDLSLQVSNFNLNKGGIWGDPVLGTPEGINRMREGRIFRDFSLCGLIFIMSLYHLEMYFYRRKDKTALYFGIFCLIIVIRILSTGELFLTRLIPDISWNLHLTIEYLSFYLAIPVFSLYLYNLYPRQNHKPVVRTILGVSAPFILLTLFTPPRIFNRTLPYFQLISIIVCSYSLYVLVRAMKSHSKSSSTLLTGFFILVLFFLNDVLHSLNIIHTAFLMPVGLFIFIFTQSLLIQRISRELFETVEKQKNELVISHTLFEKSRLGTILGLAKLAEFRDEDTGQHLERMREYCRILAIALSKREGYCDYITERYIDDLYQSAILHDIGKVSVPDSILLKPGKLNEEEYELMKLHTVRGGEALENIEAKIGMESFLTLGKEIAWAHHEKWDGSGYPKGLKGREIPLSARITSVADVYDALTSERPYKKAFSHKEARKIILEGEGIHFDPLLIKIFLEVEGQLNEIRLSYGEANPLEAMKSLRA